MKSEHKDCYRMTLKTSYYHRTTLRRFDKNQAWDVIQIHCKLHAEKKFSSFAPHSLTHLRLIFRLGCFTWCRYESEDCVCVCMFEVRRKREKKIEFSAYRDFFHSLALLFFILKSEHTKNNIHLIPRGLFCWTIVRFLSDWLLLWVHGKNRGI